MKSDSDFKQVTLLFDSAIGKKYTKNDLRMGRTIAFSGTFHTLLDFGVILDKPEIIRMED